MARKVETIPKRIEVAHEQRVLIKKRVSNDLWAYSIRTSDKTREYEIQLCSITRSPGGGGRREGNSGWGAHFNVKEYDITIES